MIILVMMHIPELLIDTQGKYMKTNAYPYRYFPVTNN